MTLFDRFRGLRRNGAAGWLVWTLWLALGPRLLIADSVTLQLARELDVLGDWSGSATEFRRLALGSENKQEQGAYLWWAAWQTRRAGDRAEADHLAERAEKADPTLAVPALLLRGQTALDDRRWAEAAFYFGTVSRSNGPDEAKRLALWRLTEASLQEGDLTAVREALKAGGPNMEKAAATWANYETGRDKSPRLGGWLGAVPGMGYMYAGEWANGFRSLLLNGLFLYGMIHTEEKEQWGALSVITFFEITWYSGSIYGGIDAAHRFNRRRLEACVEVFREGALLEPDADTLPGLSLRYRF